MATILIIGGGVAGLTAGIYAQKNGCHAIVCERHSVAGGNLTGWQRGKYHIDNCIHWLTGTNPHSEFYKTWTDVGALGDGVDVMRTEVLFTAEAEGKTLSLYRDLDKVQKELLQAAPEDEKEIRQMISVVRYLQGMNGIGGEKHDKKNGAFRAFFGLPILLKYYNLSAGRLAQRFHSPLVRAFLTSFLGEACGCLALLSVMAHFCGENGDIPSGSSVAMAQRMATKLQKLGGELLLKKEAVRILHENGQAKSVEFSDGSILSADYVVLATDPASAFGKLLDLPMPKALKKQYENKGLIRFSSYHAAFSCDADKVPFTGDVAFELPAKYRLRLRTKYLIVREFSHEKSFSPSGKNILTTMTYCSEQAALSFIRLRKNKAAYERRKQHLAQLIGQAIVEKYPQLRDSLTCIDVWTPATYKRYVDSKIGSYMSFLFAEKIVPRWKSNAVKGLKNVVLATQWLQEPGGLPIAAESGKKAILTILRKEKKPVQAE